jgi:hypothetical protein
VNPPIEAGDSEAETDIEGSEKKHAVASIDTDGSDKENGPPSTTSSMQVMPMSPHVSTTNEAYLQSLNDEDGSAALDFFCTIVEGFALVRHTSGLFSNQCSENMHLNLLSSLFVVFKNVESVSLPIGWEKGFSERV